MNNTAAAETNSSCDCGRPASVSASDFTLAAVLVRILDLYHLLIAPFLANHSGLCCRFEPTCSRYASAALLRHGLWRGGYLALRRLARCYPWGNYDYDPVPEAAPVRAGNQ